MTVAPAGYLVYSVITTGAAVSLLALLAPAIRRRDQRALLMGIGLAAMVPTYTGLMLKGLDGFVSPRFMDSWWVFADWAVLLFFGALAQLVLDGLRTGAGRGPGVFARYGRLALYLPAVLLVPVRAAVPEAWLMMIGAFYGLLTLTALARQFDRSATARRWFEGLLSALLIWLIVDGLLPALPGQALPGAVRAAGAALPHALVVLLYAQAAVDEGRIRTSAPVRVIAPSLALAAALLGGGAAGSLLPSDAGLLLAAASSLVLYAGFRSLFRRWQPSGVGERSALGSPGAGRMVGAPDTDTGLKALPGPSSPDPGAEAARSRPLGSVEMDSRGAASDSPQAPDPPSEPDEGRPPDRPSILIEQLQRQACEDPLTGLLNRRAFDMRIATLLTHPECRDRPRSLVLFDLDRFKEVNDHRGHPEGDRILRRLGRLLREQEQRFGPVYRIGGDEFALLLDGRDEESVKALCLELRDVLHDGLKGAGVAASFGVATLQSGEAGTPEGWFHAADVALYREKRRRRAGRKRMDG